MSTNLLSTKQFLQKGQFASGEGVIVLSFENLRQLIADELCKVHSFEDTEDGKKKLGRLADEFIQGLKSYVDFQICHESLSHIDLQNSAITMPDTDSIRARLGGIGIGPNARQKSGGFWQNLFGGGDRQSQEQRR